MKLTTKVRVKSQLGITASTYDTILETLINATSLQVETFLSRLLSHVERTEYFTGGVRSLWLAAYPITEVASVHESVDVPRSWTANTLVSSDYYDIDTTRGVIYRLDADFMSGRRVVRVVYTGGYAEEGSGELAVPDTIKQATTDQVVYYFRQRSKIGTTVEVLNNDRIERNESWGLLEGVKHMLMPYRRPPVAE